MFRHVHNSLYMYDVHLLAVSSSKETILLTMLPVFVSLSVEGPFIAEKKESRAGGGEGRWLFLPMLAGEGISAWGSAGCLSSVCSSLSPNF
jgi:hypothetical protein